MVSGRVVSYDSDVNRERNAGETVPAEEKALV